MTYCEVTYSIQKKSNEAVDVSELKDSMKTKDEEVPVSDFVPVPRNGH